MVKEAFPLFVFSIAMMTITSHQAQAQIHRKVTLKASVPYEFIVGNRVLPAGTYTFEMATGVPKSTDQGGVLVVHNLERKLYVAVATGVENEFGAHARPKLVFVRNGDRVYLSKVWRQGETAGLTVHTPAIEGEMEQSQLLTLDAGTSGGI